MAKNISFGGKLIRINSSGNLEFNGQEFSFGGGGSTLDVAQTAHGFSVGEPIYFDGTDWALAKADSDTTLGLALVETVTDVNNFTLILGGEITGLTGLTAGAFYFVSDTTAGVLTTTQPSTYSNPIMQAISTTSGIVLPWRAQGGDEDDISGFNAGDIKIVPTSTVPSGFLECNGAAVSRTTYSELFTAIGTAYGAGNGSTTFIIPDLRGVFVRGWDHGRNLDSTTSRSIGTYQSDAFQGHWHQLYGSSGNDGGGGRTDIYSTYTYAGSDHVRYPVTTGSHGTPRYTTETRPKNVAMMFVIKY